MKKSLPLLSLLLTALASAASPSPVPEQEPTSAAADTFYSTLFGELRKGSGAEAASLFAPNEGATLSKFSLFGPAANGAKRSIRDATGQPFQKALAIDVFAPKGEIWHIMGRLTNPVPLTEGNAYLVTFYARGRVPGIGGSDAVFEVAMKDRKVGASWASAPILVGDSWERFYLPFTAARSAAKDEAELVFVLGSQVQQIEIGGLAWVATNVPATQLPGFKPVSKSYAGREAGAAWREAALERIEKIRKADLRVKVVDASGQAVPDAEVGVEMTRHAFKWGTAMSPSHTLTSNNPVQTAERETFPKYFNHIAIDTDLKQATWLDANPGRREKIIAALRQLHDEGYTLNNGVIVWPGFRTNESWLPLKDKPEELKEAVDDFIRQIAKATAPYVDEVIVVNEPYSDREIARILGEDSFSHWYRMVRELQPNATLWLNEAGLTSNNDGRDTPRQEFIMSLGKSLIDQGLLDGIGDQAHFNKPVDPERVYAVWDRLATLGKPLQVTEFDVKFDDDLLEADYTRDFTILAFSHPAMDAFTMWGFIDEAHWKKSAPLFFMRNGKLRMKASGYAWIDLVMNQWWSIESGTTNAKGVFETRGFLGDYKVTASKGDQSASVDAELPNDGATVTVTLK